MNILIVDHDAERRGRLKRTLVRAGHPVTDFADPESAGRHFVKAPHGVVIAGLRCRGRNGSDLFRRIRTYSSPAQSFLISLVDPSEHAFAEGGEGTPGSDSIADDWLSSPVRPAEIHMRLDAAKRALERRSEEAAQLRRITRIPADSPHPIIEVSSAGDLIHANLASMPLMEAWGWAAGRPAPAPLRHLASATLAVGKHKRAEIPCKDRTYSFLAMGLEGGDVCLYGHDVTDLASANRDLGVLKGQAFGLTLRDPLTGLPTRILLTDRLSQALTRARQASTKIALVKVNIDNCADINDAYGHSQGDQVIGLVGECLQDEVRIGDTVFRDSGDGFILLLTGINNREAAGATCTRLIRTSQQAGEAAGLGIRFTLSMGVALYPEDADSESALIECAEKALAEAKNSGRDCWRDYQSAVDANPMLGADRLVPRLMSALQSRQLQAQYQPIISAVTGAVAGFEALVRWHDPELGWVPPDRFIPVAEARGLIAEVGRQMADRAFQQLAVWRAAGHKVGVSLNISKRQLWESSFCEEMRQLARDHGVAPEWIMLEVTERQSLLHDRVCRETLEKLAAAGFPLSLDDFGSGHSTFDVVSELPFQELKINMNLSRKVHTPRGRHVVSAITGMCRNLGVECVAEGIEDQSLGDRLRDIGATRLQGYYYAPPLSAEASVNFLAEQTAPTTRRGGSAKTPTAKPTRPRSQSRSRKSKVR